jgi:hypothetical protein
LFARFYVARVDLNSRRPAEDLDGKNQPQRIFFSREQSFNTFKGAVRDADAVTLVQKRKWFQRQSLIGR